MSKKLKRFLKYLPSAKFSNFSYSQEGEDILLNKLLGYKENGFYVDVGGHHPFRISNTHLFYLKGWNGVNIEPMPSTKTLYDKHRKRDINLEMGIAIEETEMTYYMFTDPALNGFSKERSEHYHNNTKYKIINTKSIKTAPLSKILNDLFPEGKKIDFLNVDVEGLDLDVLKSNDWEKFRPDYIVIESHDKTLKNITECPIYTFLEGKNYELISKLDLSFIYKSII